MALGPRFDQSTVGPRQCGPHGNPATTNIERSTRFAVFTVETQVRRVAIYHCHIDPVSTNESK